MGKLTALGIKNLKAPGRYSDGEGLMLKDAGPAKGDGFSQFNMTDAGEISGLAHSQT
jgi:hypothetical protein